MLRIPTRIVSQTGLRVWRPPSGTWPSRWPTSAPKRRSSPRQHSLRHLGTSDATVVRTAKSLGYSGLGDLRRALTVQSENPPLGERLRRTLEQTPGNDPLGSAVRNHLSELESLGRNVSPAAFLDAVALLANSNRIVWRGVGPSAALASYGELICPTGRQAQYRLRAYGDLVC